LACGFAFLLSLIVWLFNQVVPSSVIEALLTGADWLTGYTIPDFADSTPDADLKTRDDEANTVQNWAIATAIGEGAAQA
jgi:hypothetical protein